MKIKREVLIIGKIRMYIKKKNLYNYSIERERGRGREMEGSFCILFGLFYVFGI